MMNYYDYQKGFGEVEMRLKDEGFKVHHLMRDFRGDQDDDYGFLIAVCEKKSTFYVHLIFISRNYELGDLILDKDDIRLFTDRYCFPDFKSFNTKKEADNYVIEVAILLEIINNEYGKDYYEFSDCEYSDFVEDIQSKFPILDYDDFKRIRWFMFAYTEYDNRNDYLLTNLTKVPYVENFEEYEDYKEVLKRYKQSLSK